MWPRHPSPVARQCAPPLCTTGMGFEMVSGCAPQVVSSFDGGVAAAALTGGGAARSRQLAAAVRLEAAAVEQAFGDVKAADAHLAAAEAALGMYVQLTGENFQNIGNSILDEL